jgi:hypothetical protein
VSQGAQEYWNLRKELLLKEHDAKMKYILRKEEFIDQKWQLEKERHAAIIHNSMPSVMPNNLYPSNQTLPYIIPPMYPSSGGDYMNSLNQ